MKLSNNIRPYIHFNRMKFYSRNAGRRVNVLEGMRPLYVTRFFKGSMFLTIRSGRLFDHISSSIREAGFWKIEVFKRNINSRSKGYK